MIATNRWQGFLAVSYLRSNSDNLESAQVTVAVAASRKRVSYVHHVKKLMYTVNNGEPGPRFGRMLLEQFGVSTPRSKGGKSQA
jgi:hypothetical protein